ncbi:MAG TPA: FGGY family carbohydrate kinase [Chitinophagaceae bacterium]|nr:FGGY family carbohydrate kinase [Chitinophagaceae bacterium]
MRRNNAAIANKSRDANNIAIPVIAVFDVGKTNKKLLLFDEQYNVVYEEEEQLPEISDEDGFACEDVHALTQWLQSSFNRLVKNKRFAVKALNFSAYGASFVHLDEQVQPCLPLYNYLKPYPENLKRQFYDSYGGESLVAKQTASPVLGSLNSGMQLYRLRYERPAVFEKIKYSLHLPQYCSFVLSGNTSSDITSIGCHTNLWNFKDNAYHAWVYTEGIDKKLPGIKPGNYVAGIAGEGVKVGIGLHDSSAALIPYLYSYEEPFVLLSTGTWCISLNPFNHEALSNYELHHDCLCYLTYKGEAVKASRLFAGYAHEQQTKRLAAYFNKPEDYYRGVSYNSRLAATVNKTGMQQKRAEAMTLTSVSGTRNLQEFDNYEAAYHQLISDIITQQVRSTNLVLTATPVRKIFVDGGFSRNSVYMHMLAGNYPNMAIYAAAVPQASALGAAMVLHEQWNDSAMPPGLVKLQRYLAE